MSREPANEAFLESSFLHGTNAMYIEELYARYKDNADAVDDQWKTFFAALKDDRASVEREAAGPSWAQTGHFPPAMRSTADADLLGALAGDFGASSELRIAERIQARAQTSGVEVSPSLALRATQDSIRAIHLIRSYRLRGHMVAKLDPLNLDERPQHPELSPLNWGFTDGDLDRPVFLDSTLPEVEIATVRQILEILRNTYCNHIGFEYMHIGDIAERRWIQRRIEGKHIAFTGRGKKAILNKLIEAEGFEKFLDVKYTGTKRFGLDGAESVIPALEQIIKRGGALGIKEIVIGMAHRGRLNVLANVMGKPHRAIFNEFKGGSFKPDEVEGSGDVKYHLGASSDRTFDGNNVHLSLTANPSHLEIVDPVVLGKVRAKQDQHNDKKRDMVLPLLIHGDAAFAGQGVVAECLGLSGLRGHRTGGSIHFIINNQIGFTTAPRFARSSPYPSDVARMIEAPIFHVNGDDPEAVVHVTKLATEFRQRFHKPVVVDMFCYRRFGHNEGDEPSFTQPKMYSTIRSHPGVVELYSKKLIAEGTITEAEAQKMGGDFRNHLEGELASADGYKPNKADWLDGKWATMHTAEEGDRRGNTAVAPDVLQMVGRKLSVVPTNFRLHKTLDRLLKRRLEMIESGVGIDWSFAEHLAFGTLVHEGFAVRLSGQDCERGTFSQRHAVLIDQESEKRWTPLKHISPDQGRFEVINSMLSEEAVLGFEYGYSLAEPKSLTMWEAQFGDFVNGAQVVIDQFISSGERKWLRMSGLVLLLPHGYEGQGPEHSSGRLERFLQACAEDNMQVANCTTPANYFHILRRQLHREFRKPLVIMTPKSLLRHKRVVSNIAEFGPDATFHRVLKDDAHTLPNQKIMLKPDDQIKRVVLCSGKVYYDLYETREERGIDDVVILRVEQLYPVPARTLIEEVGRFKNAEVVWCQEEPKNMGAWTFMEPNLEWVLEHCAVKAQRPRYAGRPASASTATGQMSKHVAEQKALVAAALE
jgi:2-oxoglutarate dehydrogenase E1 component